MGSCDGLVGAVMERVFVLVLWLVFYMFFVLVQTPGTKNVHGSALDSMKSRFATAKFEEQTMPNTIFTLPGSILVTRRPKMTENTTFKHDFLLLAKAQLRLLQC